MKTGSARQPRGRHPGSTVDVTKERRQCYQDLARSGIHLHCKILGGGAGGDDRMDAGVCVVHRCAALALARIAVVGDLQTLA